jgi:hypothetical protein
MNPPVFRCGAECQSSHPQCRYPAHSIAKEEMKANRLLYGHNPAEVLWSDALIADYASEFHEDFATGVIKHRSHIQRKKAEIGMWVHENFPQSGVAYFGPSYNRGRYLKMIVLHRPLKKSDNKISN